MTRARMFLTWLLVGFGVAMVFAAYADVLNDGGRLFTIWFKLALVWLTVLAAVDTYRLAAARDASAKGSRR